MQMPGRMEICSATKNMFLRQGRKPRTVVPTGHQIRLVRAAQPPGLEAVRVAELPNRRL